LTAMRVQVPAQMPRHLSGLDIRQQQHHSHEKAYIIHCYEPIDDPVSESKQSRCLNLPPGPKIRLLSQPMTTQYSAVPHLMQSRSGTRGMSHRITLTLIESSEQLSASTSTQRSCRMPSNGNLQARFQTRHVTCPFCQSCLTRCRLSNAM
jgi:hypothetical protein